MYETDAKVSASLKSSITNLFNKSPLGAPERRGPGSLNPLNTLLLGHCIYLVSVCVLLIDWQFMAIFQKADNTNTFNTTLSFKVYNK